MKPRLPEAPIATDLSPQLHLHWRRIMKTKLHKEIDAQLKFLKERGVEIKRSDVIESMAKAKGFRNAHEMMASEKKENIHPFDEEKHEAPNYDDKARIRALELEKEELQIDIRNLEKMSGIDWVDMKKSGKMLRRQSHFGKDPLDDEKLHLLRLAVSDNHCKGSAGERESTRYKVHGLAEKCLPGLLARLDMAEEALGKGEIFSGPILEAIKDALSVTAHRDGDDYDTIFLPDERDNFHRAVELAGKSYGIYDLQSVMDAEHLDEDEKHQALVEDMDSFSMEPAHISIDVKTAVEYLKRGEGSALLYSTLMALGRQLGLNPRDISRYEKDRY